MPRLSKLFTAAAVTAGGALAAYGAYEAAGRLADLFTRPRSPTSGPPSPAP